MLREKNNHDVTSGVLQKLTLDKTTRTIKSKHTNNANKANNANNDTSVSFSIPIVRDFHFELNLYEMTFSYKPKAAARFTRSFGYKQVHKYTLQLSKDEQSFAKEESNLGFKLFFDNKAFLLFCNNSNELKIWIEAFNKFFEKKTSAIKSLYKNRKSIAIANADNENTNLNLPTHNVNLIEEWKFVEIFLTSFSESFVCEEYKLVDMTSSNKRINGRDYIKFRRVRHFFNDTVVNHNRRTYSSDKIYKRNKTVEPPRMFNKNINFVTTVLYQSKMLNFMQNSKSERIENNFKTRRINLLKYNNNSKNVDVNFFSFFMNLLLDTHEVQIRQLVLYEILRNLREIHKSLKEIKLVENINKMQKEMSDEWEHFKAEQSDKADNPNNLKEKLKNELKYSHKRIPNKKDLFSSEDYSSISLNMSELISGKEIDNKKNVNNPINIFKGNQHQQSFEVNFNENFQPFSETQRDFENEIKEYDELKRIREKFLNRNKIKQEEKINNASSSGRCTKGMYGKKVPDDCLVITNQQKYKINLKMKTLCIFPSSNKGKADYDGEYASTIDNLHFKPDYGVHVEQVEVNNENNDVNMNYNDNTNNVPNNRAKPEMEPHFGNIAIIAQRYNKIDIMATKNLTNLSN